MHASVGCDILMYNAILEKSYVQYGITQNGGLIFQDYVTFHLRNISFFSIKNNDYGAVIIFFILIYKYFRQFIWKILKVNL